MRLPMTNMETRHGASRKRIGKWLCLRINNMYCAPSEAIGEHTTQSRSIIYVESFGRRNKCTEVTMFGDFTRAQKEMQM